MAETITGGGRIVGRKHNWNNKIRGQKLVRLEPNKTRTPELNYAGVLQWVEGMIYAKKRGYDRIKEEPYIGPIARILKSIKEKCGER